MVVCAGKVTRVIIKDHIRKNALKNRILLPECKEYAKAVYVQQESPVLTRRSRTETVSECGIVSVPLIVGGVRANSKEFPHMVDQKQSTPFFL